DVLARAPDSHELRVFGERVRELAVARDDHALDGVGVEERFSGERIHATDEVAQVALDDEIGAARLERLHGRRPAAGGATEDLTPTLVRDVRILLGAGKG